MPRNACTAPASSPWPPEPRRGQVPCPGFERAPPGRGILAASQAKRAGGAKDATSGHPSKNACPFPQNRVQHREMIGMAEDRRPASSSDAASDASPDRDPHTRPHFFLQPRGGGSGQLIATRVKRQHGGSVSLQDGPGPLLQLRPWVVRPWKRAGVGVCLRRGRSGGCHHCLEQPVSLAEAVGEAVAEHGDAEGDDAVGQVPGCQD